jgi:hypothetical protein
MAPQTTIEPEVSRQDIARYRANLQGEIDGAALYRTMADVESTPALRELYRRLAEAETRHGSVWRERLGASGVATERMRPSWRARVLMLIARRVGPNALVATISELESADQTMYDARCHRRLGDDPRRGRPIRHRPAGCRPRRDAPASSPARPLDPGERAAFEARFDTRPSFQLEATPAMPVGPERA